MRSWLREEVLGRVLRNAAMLGAGKLAGVVLHLASLALTASLLGASAFGLLILVRSYAQATSGIARFQSWQSLIRFGAARVETGDRDGFRDLAALTITVDALSGLAASAGAFLLAPRLGSLFGIAPDDVMLAQVYCLAIPFLTSSTPNGILRIFDRFDLLSWQNLVTPTVRLVGIGTAFLLGLPLWGMVAAWLVSDLIGEIFLWQQAWREMKRRACLGGSRPSSKRALGTNPGIVRFSLAANGSATVNQASIPLLTLYVGALLGPAAAGVFRIAHTVLEAFSTPVELATRSLFPELARLRARGGEDFRRLVARALALSAGLGVLLSLIVAVAAPYALMWGMGADFAPAGALLQVMALSLAPALAAFPLEAALMASGKAGRVLSVRTFAAASTFTAAGLLVSSLGLPAIGVALTAGAVAALAGFLMSARGQPTARPELAI